MRDTRDIINEKCNELWRKIFERLSDEDDEFIYTYTTYGDEEVLSGKFTDWLKGNARFLLSTLDDYEGKVMLGDFKRFCEVIGQTYIENLVGKQIVNELRAALKLEDHEIDELYGGDKHDKCSD